MIYIYTVFLFKQKKEGKGGGNGIADIIRRVVLSKKTKEKRGGEETCSGGEVAGFCVGM